MTSPCVKAVAYYNVILGWGGWWKKGEVWVGERNTDPEEQGVEMGRHHHSIAHHTPKYRRAKLQNTRKRSKNKSNNNEIRKTISNPIWTLKCIKYSDNFGPKIVFSQNCLFLCFSNRKSNGEEGNQERTCTGAIEIVGIIWHALGKTTFNQRIQKKGERKFRLGRLTWTERLDSISVAGDGGQGGQVLHVHRVDICNGAKFKFVISISKLSHWKWRRPHSVYLMIRKCFDCWNWPGRPDLNWGRWLPSLDFHFRSFPVRPDSVSWPDFVERLPKINNNKKNKSFGVQRTKKQQTNKQTEKKNHYVERKRETTSIELE